MEAYPAGAIKEPDTPPSRIQLHAALATGRGSALALDGCAYYEGKGSGEAAWQPLDGGDDDNNIDVYYDGDCNGDEGESAPADARSPPPL